MFSDEQLKQLIEGKCVGEKYPYNTNNEKEIEAHIRRLFYRLKQIPNLIVEAEWDHFGSGYASFVEFFCYRKEDVKMEDDPYGNRHIEMDGIIVDICRLAPVAIMGEDDRHKTIRIETNEDVSGGRGLLSSPNALVISEKYQPLAEKIKKVLEEFDYKVLDAEQLDKPLPFKAKIPTIFREPNKYLVMDAYFYWED